MSREAMQQALEVLALLQGDIEWTSNSPTLKFVNSTVAALRAALAEPEQVGINGLTAAETDASASVKGLVGKPEHPVAQDTRAEFEAWAASYSTFSLKRYDDEAHGITGYISVEQTMLWHAWQAAKTNAPIPRRPVELTDEEIDGLRLTTGYAAGLERFTAIARAVIAAYQKKQGEQT